MEDTAVRSLAGLALMPMGLSPRPFWRFAVAVALCTAGLSTYGLVSFYLIGRPREPRHGPLDVTADAHRDCFQVYRTPPSRPLSPGWSPRERRATAYGRSLR